MPGKVPSLTASSGSCPPCLYLQQHHHHHHHRHGLAIIHFSAHPCTYPVCQIRMGLAPNCLPLMAPQSKPNLAAARRIFSSTDSQCPTAHHAHGNSPCQLRVPYLFLSPFFRFIGPYHRMPPGNLAPVRVEPSLHLLKR